MGNDSDERQTFKIEKDRLQPVGPGQHPSMSTSFDATHLDFGHYAGSSIEEVARIDPEYLHWLVRHPSGSRYRAEIRRALGVAPSPASWQR